MYQNIKDLRKFYLITVPAMRTYRQIWVRIPRINQVQCIANEVGDEFLASDSWHRTKIHRIRDIWTVQVEVQRITRNEALALCPAIAELKYSLKMIEDLQLRDKTKLEYLKRLRCI